MDTRENMLIKWSELTKDDIVIIPAFGITIELQNKLKEIGIDAYRYNTTCPFVEKVWNRAASLGKDDHTIIIHGKLYHEETRATYSHSKQNGASLIVRDLEETKLLAKIIGGELPKEKFYDLFAGKYSEGFDVDKNLNKIGVVNQTTMLATETQEIADYLKNTMKNKFGESKINNHFADTRDTLCYATYDNQNATYGLLNKNADLAIVVGGYNSSNTSHLVELLEPKFKTYFISDANKIISDKLISHFDIHSKTELQTENFLPVKEKINIALTSGASCPDSVVDDVLKKLLSFFKNVDMSVINGK
jgi:4-hydroxy-3-methylbut-2-enyl diphosphate reductase